MSKEPTIRDVFDEFTEEQKNIVYTLAGWVVEGADVDRIDIEYYLRHFNPTQKKVTVAMLQRVEKARRAEGEIN